VTTAAPPRLSAGVLTADLTRLGAELEILRGQAAWVHVDVMDGVFCPQLTVGPAFVTAVASAGIPVDAHLMVTEPRRLLPDIAAAIGAAGAGIITVHAEATAHLHRTMTELTELAEETGPPELTRPAGLTRQAGQTGQTGQAEPSRSFLRGVAINPGTPVAAVEPVLELADLVLVLAVSPGWPGQAPAASTRRRVAAVRQLAASIRPEVLVGVDGGVTAGNAAEIASWGADVIVSGSAIFDRVDPPGNLRRISQALRSPAAAAAGPTQEVADGRQ
jgi:ribulose-phosphate 3-epimerase